MNNQHEQAGFRQKLFRNNAERQGAIVLPGCWGGDYNCDQLALYRSGTNLILLLGLKVTNGSEESIALDAQSLGLYMQLSPVWVRAMSQCLRQTPELAHYAAEIEDACARDTLITSVMILNADTEQVSVLRVAVGNGEG